MSTTHETVAPRRRWQRGSLRLEKQGWVLTLRDEIAEEGQRPRRRVFIGTPAALPTKTIARAAADRRLRDLGLLDSTPGKSLTIRELAKAYVADALPVMKPSARASAKSLIEKHIVPFFGDRRLPEVSGRSPQQFVNHLQAQNLARKSIKNIVAVLSRMLLWARQLNYQAPKLDPKMIKWPPDDLEQEHRFFSPEEAARIIEHAPWPWRVYFALLAFLGLRAGEGLGLTWSHLQCDWASVEADTDVILIRQSAVLGKIQTLKSRGSKADLPVPPALKSILREYREQHWVSNVAGLLFATDVGQPLWSSTVRVGHLYPLLARLGIQRGGLHSFRHGAASALFAAGANAATVKSVLRHADMKTTLRYTHQLAGEQRLAVSSAATLLQNAGAKP